MLTEQTHREHEEIVEVRGRRLEEPALVLGVDLGELALGRGDGARRVLLGADELVLERRDPRLELARREALRVEIQVAADVVGEADGVGLVVDRERRPVPEDAGLAPQDPGARRVERRDPHPVGDRTDEGSHPLLHLPRGLVGEGDRQDPEGRDAALGDQVRDPVGEDAGLARSGARDDEERTVGRGDRLVLDRVQAREQIVFEGGGFGHGGAIVQVFDLAGVRSGLEHECDRTIIDQLDEHVGAEAPAGHRRTQVAEGGRERLDQRFGDRGRRGRGPRRPPTATRVGVERELAHDERGAAGIAERSVHDSVRVVEDAQVPHLVGEPAGGALVVVVRDADEDTQSASDLPDHVVADAYVGAGDALNERSQAPTASISGE